MHYHKSGHDLASILRSVFEERKCVGPATYIPKRADTRPYLRDIEKQSVVLSVPDALFNWSEFGPSSKLVHFVREPADMIVSGYLYHAQNPIPPSEGWLLDSRINICEEDPRDPAFKREIQEFVGSSESMNVESAFRRVRTLCARMKRELYPQARTIHEMLKTADRNYEDMYAGIRVEAVRALISKQGGDLPRMAANAIWESRAPAGTSFRVFMSDIPVGERTVVNSTVTALMRYLMPDPPPSQTTGTKAFWEGCITREAAVKRCVEGMYVDLHKAANATAGKPTHVTQGFVSGYLREHYKQRLLTDPDLGPLLRIIHHVMLETTTPALVHQ